MQKLFVIMPFGRRRVEPGPDGELDFDEVYRQIVRKGGERSGWKVLRIDELSEPGVITDQYLRELYTADIVVADISAPNANVFYELGVRQAISTGGTILIAHRGSPIPFDLQSQRITFYDLTSAGCESAAGEIGRALDQHAAQPAKNPIRAFLEHVAATASPERDLVEFERDLDGRVRRAKTADELIAMWQWARNFPRLPAVPLIALADRLSEHKEWSVAADALRTALRERPNDFEIHRKLGWYLHHLGEKHDTEVVAAFDRALELNPGDPETLGLMAGRLKRLGKFREAAAIYGEGVKYWPNNRYLRINQAFMEIYADPQQPQKGIELYRAFAADLQAETTGPLDEWGRLNLGESLFAIGDAEGARSQFAQAWRIASSRNSLDSAAGQLELFSKIGFKQAEARALASQLRQLAASWLRGRFEASNVAEADGAVGKTAVPAATLPVLIHLSDIHFGRITREGKTIEMHRFFDSENSQRLARHLVEEFKGKRSPFSCFSPEQLHLVVSGDLAYTGASSEFDDAFACLDEVSSGIGVPRERVHIIPGNHDVSWDLSGVDKAYRLDRYVEFLVRFYGQSLFTRRYPRFQLPRSGPSTLIAFSHDPDSRLLIAGLNSCIYETEQHHYGFVGERQLKLLDDLVIDCGVDDTTVRVALIHHHLHPFPEYLTDRDGTEVWQDLSTVRDAGVVEQILKQLRFDLVLHGHKHKPQLRETLVRDRAPDVATPNPDNHRLIVCGAGSVGVSREELAQGEPNQYQVIEVRQVPRRPGTEFVRISYRSLAVKGGARWTTTQVWELAG